jgi:hypothetical protein
MSAQLLDEVRSLVRSIRGLRCWYVSYGGAAGPTFQLALGKKVRRSVPVRNPVHSEEYRQFEGEANLLVWCTWRLDGPSGPLTSSDDTPEGISKGLPQLREAKVRGASLIDNAGDLIISFSNKLKVRIFCDHVPGAPSFDGNWELWLTDRALLVGPGSRFEFVERRQDQEKSLPARQRHSPNG